jgi:non-specific serine/threonine protein kinase/serine/threonine-protein kinase
LKGDLDTILLQALHADPVRRYGSVGALGDDLRRHLERRPVRARPDTVPYRFTRFVRRHTVGVIAVTLIVVALVGGVLTTAYQARRAEVRSENIRSLANAMLFDLHDAVRHLPGATPARQLLVSHALTYLDQLQAEAPSDPTLLLELAAAYEQIGEIQGDPHRTNLGDLEGALSSYGEALALREAVWQRDTANAAVRHALGNSYGRMAVVTSWSGRNDEAILLSKRGIELLNPLYVGGPAPRVVAGDLGRIQAELGWWLIWAGRIEEGMDLLDTGIAVLQDVADPASDDPEPGIDLWRAYSYRVDGFWFTGRHAEALEVLRATALPFLRSMAEQHPMHPEVEYGLHVCYRLSGIMALELGDLPSATSAYTEAQRVAEALVRADSSNQKAAEGLAFSRISLGEVLVMAGELDEAVLSFRRGIEVIERLNQRNPLNLELANMRGNGLRKLCRALQEGQRQEEALEWCLAAELTLKGAVAGNEGNAVVRSNLASAYVATARVYRGLARGAEASVAGQHREDARVRYEDALHLLRGLEGTDAVPEIEPDSVAAELARLTGGS